MVACRSFEVFLHVDAEFAASFADYFRVGREALLPFVSVVVVIAASGTAAFARPRAVRAVARRQRLARMERLVESAQSAGGRDYAILLAGIVALVTLVWSNRDVFDGLIGLHQRPSSAPIAAISFAARSKHLAFSTGCAILSFFMVLRGRGVAAGIASAVEHSCRYSEVAMGAAAARTRSDAGANDAATHPVRTVSRRRIQRPTSRRDRERRRSRSSCNDSARRATVRVRRDAAGLRMTEMTRQIFQD